MMKTWGLTIVLTTQLAVFAAGWNEAIQSRMRIYVYGPLLASRTSGLPKFTIGL